MHVGNLSVRLMGALFIGTVSSFIACSGGGGGSAPAVSVAAPPVAASPTTGSTLATALLEVVVAPGGQTTAPGTLEAPTTLEHARDLLRAYPRASAGILRVLIRGGLYPRTTTFELGSQDSGSQANPIEYVAKQGETPRFIGGAMLDPASLSPVTSGDPNYSRLAPEAVAHILVADLSAYASSLGTFDSRVNDSDGTNQAAEIFVGESPMTLARYPDAVDPESIPLAKRGLAFRVSSTASPDVSGIYAYVADDALGRPYFQLRKAGETWSLAAEAKGPQWFLSNRGDLGGTGSPCVWGNAEGLNGPTGRFPASGGGAQGDLLIEPADGSQALPGFMLIGSTDGRTALETTTPSPRTWAKPQEAMLYGFTYYSWFAVHMRPSSYNPLSGKVQLPSKPPYGLRIGQPLFAYNVLEELTVPGEYFIDRTLNRLYLRPPGDAPPAEIMLSRMQDPLMRLQNLAWTSLRGLTFEASKDTLVEAPTCTSVTFQACTFRNAGGRGLRLGGSQNIVDSCILSGLGKAGIQAWGGDRYQLAPSGTHLQNCDISRVARLFWVYQPGIQVKSPTSGAQENCVGLVVANNALHHLPHEALEFLGNDHQILRNDIHHVCQWTNDAGAIYTGRDWGSQGNLIANNLFRSNSGPMGTHVSSVYLDDCASGIAVTGNIFYYSNALFAIQHGGGRDITLSYNIIVGPWVGITTDDRGLIDINNLPGDSENLLEKIQLFNYQHPPWSARYPGLAAIPSDWTQLAGSHWLQPEGVVVQGNLMFGSGASLLNQPSNGAAVRWFKQVSNNLEGVDPGFVNAAGGDFTLRADSPMRAIPNFPGIDASKWGIQR
jgi:hypothetical protein